METVLDAAKELLVDVSELLGDAGAEFVIVGGWSPYLLNKTSYAHPGTKDVDVLFSDGSAEYGLSKYIKLFLENGFVPSAKHDFQLIKNISVGDNELAFNVDLLHPSETIRNPELLTDHLNLHIEDGDLQKEKFVRSIVLPSSKILFQDDFQALTTVVAPLSSRTVKVPLITAAGAILSKCESVKVAKRPRDSFDIYLSIMSEGVERVASVIRPYKDVEGVKHMLESLEEFVTQQSSLNGYKEFDVRVSRYIRNLPSPLPSDKVMELLAGI